MNLLKKLLATGLSAVLALAMLVAPLPALAQTYPTATPSYIPNAVLPVTTLSATGDYYFSANGTSTASVRMSALSGTLVAAIQASNDPLGTANGSATWSTIYYLDPTAPNTAAANSITANGLYIFSSAGYTRFRVHVTTLTGGSHVVTIQATANLGAGVTYQINTPATATVAVAPLTSTNLSDTIATTNTFQSIQVSTAGRNGCLIQNQSTTDIMWVYFGAVADATKGASFILDPTHGLAISCSVGGLGVVTDQVSITGTSTDAYTANFQ